MTARGSGRGPASGNGSGEGRRERPTGVAREAAGGAPGADLTGRRPARRSPLPDCHPAIRRTFCRGRTHPRSCAPPPPRPGSPHEAVSAAGRDGCAAGRADGNGTTAAVRPRRSPARPPSDAAAPTRSVPVSGTARPSPAPHGRRLHDLHLGPAARSRHGRPGRRHGRSGGDRALRGGHASGEGPDGHGDQERCGSRRSMHPRNSGGSGRPGDSGEPEVAPHG